ncbi:DUF2399 domain-containing protein [Streptomyces sanglieri]|uniref:DUF2399 domain-containing protein n=1 Tax=Streptomyces sanglieri TaxID=193460 RepID=UPI0035233C38
MVCRTGQPTEAPWDSCLSGALLELGIRVEEESVLDTLLTDLARRHRSCVARSRNAWLSVPSDRPAVMVMQPWDQLGSRTAHGGVGLLRHVPCPCRTA